MDSDELVSEIRREFPDCETATAERIAEKATAYQAEMGTDKTVDDWVSFMLESDQDDAVTAWYWAIGYVDPSHWDGGNPYKLHQSSLPD